MYNVYGFSHMDEYKGICGARPEGLAPEGIQQLDGLVSISLTDELADYNTLFLLSPYDTTHNRLDN